MRHFYLLLRLIGTTWLASFSLSTLAQQNIGIGTTTPNPKAALDISATDKGLLLPRLTNVQRRALSASVGVTPPGMTIFQTGPDSVGIWTYSGTRWLWLTDAYTTAPMTAGNGLTRTGTQIQLGGTLGQNTTLTTGSNSLLIAQNVSGTTAIDQNILGAGYLTFTSSGNDWQSFTAGISGSLTQVEMMLGNFTGTYPFTLTIRSGQGPAGSVLYTTNTTFNAVSSIQPYAFPISGVTLTAGQVYTIHLSGSVNTALWAYSNTNPYTGGIASLGGSNDFLFRTTVNNTVITNPMLALSDGNVGIGTTTPAARLHVAGTAGTPNVRLESLGGTGNRVVTTDATGSLSTTSFASLDPTTASNGLTKTGGNFTLGGTLTGATTIANGGNNLLITGTGRTGIGTATPSATLDVAATGTGGTVQVYNGTYGANLANQATAFASSNQLSPGNAIDGNLSNYWICVYNGLPQWYALDFGGNPRIIRQYQYYVPQLYNDTPNQWQFQGSNDGSNWSTLHAGSATTLTVGWRTFNLTNTTAYRYYRFLTFATHGGNPGFYLAELELRQENQTVVQTSTNTALKVSAGMLELPTGAAINQFTTSTTLAGNSDTSVPTERAVKTYVDSRPGADNLGNHTASQNLNLGTNLLTGGGAAGLRVDGTGQVGIGTPTPSTNLHVAGNARITGLGNGASIQIVTADADGNLVGQTLPNVAGDNFGNHQATQDVDLNGFRLGGGSATNIGVVGNHTLEFGAGVVGKEVSAGKIGYQRFSSALDIVGAGTNAGNRQIRLWAEGGTTLTGGLNVGGTTNLADNDILLRNINGLDTNHGLGWYGASKLWNGFSPDGPALYGNSGGILGTNSGGVRTTALYWTSTGRVGIGTTSPAAGTRLHVAGTAGTPNVRLESLGGTGTRMVTADATGNLGAVALPADAQQLSISGNTISLTNGGAVTVPSGESTTASNGLTLTGTTVALGGTLTGATTIAQGGNALAFTGGNVGVGVATPSATFQVGTVGVLGGPVVDQANVAGCCTTFDNLVATQTFTAGASGVLAQVELYFANNGGAPTTLTVSISAGTTAGCATGPVLASQTFAVATNAWNTVAFTPQPTVTAGGLYAITVSNGNAWGLDVSNSYSGGRTCAQGSHDHVFRTYVRSTILNSNALVVNGTGVGINAPSGGAALHVQGTALVSALAGTGTRMVTADGSGNLGTQAVPVVTDAQQLTKTGTTISLTNGGSVTDADNQNLTLTGATLSILGGNSVTLPDASATNEIQTLSISGSTISLTNGGGSVTVPSSADNLGNHTATQNLNLGAFQLVGNGGTSGVDIDAAGNVGIGTTAPTQKLEVVGTLAPTTVGTLPQLRLSRPTTTGIKWPNTFDIGIGSYATGSNSQTRVDFNLGNGATGSTDATVMTLQGNGNVGIGIPAPGTKLEVAGGVSVDAGETFGGTFTSAGNALRFGGSASGEGIGSKRTAGGNQYGLDFYTGFASRMSISSAGNVSIGGAASIGGSLTGTTAAFSSSTNTLANFVSTSADPDGVVNIQIPNTAACAGCSEMMIFRKASGTIGSITMNAATTGVAYNTTSDKRLKENITRTHYGLRDLLRIEVKDYNFIGTAAANREAGFLAQDLLHIYPEAVKEGDHGTTVTNQWAVDYGKLTPLLVQAIQDQQAIIETQRAEIETLKQQASADKAQTTATLESLADRLRALEAGQGQARK